LAGVQFATILTEIITFRIYAEDDEHQFGQPAHLEDIVLIED